MTTPRPACTSTATVPPRRRRPSRARPSTISSQCAGAEDRFDARVRGRRAAVRPTSAGPRPIEVAAAPPREHVSRRQRRPPRPTGVSARSSRTRAAVRDDAFLPRSRRGLEREQLRLEAAPAARLPTWVLGVVVGVARHDAKAQCGAFLHERAPSRARRRRTPRPESLWIVPVGQRRRGMPGRRHESPASPAGAMCGLFGTQTMPPDRPVVPPTCSTLLVERHRCARARVRRARPSTPPLPCRGR